MIIELDKSDDSHKKSLNFKLNFLFVNLKHSENDSVINSECVIDIQIKNTNISSPVKDRINENYVKHDFRL